jgi:hypothetical protein
MADPVYQLKLEKEGAGGEDFTAKMAYAYGRHSLKNCKCKKEKGTKLLMGFEFAISSIFSLWWNGFSPGMMCPEQSTNHQQCVPNNQHITRIVSGFKSDERSGIRVRVLGLLTLERTDGTCNMWWDAD